jgi:galactosylceramidase
MFILKSIKKSSNAALALSLLASSIGGMTLLPVSAAAAPTVVNINGTNVGSTYEGVGAVFSNGMTKLLMDYPANQRDDIMKMLFKPKFGAALQHVKVEIGSDVNSSSGTEPSHMRSSTDFDITRGTNLWAAQQAKALNPLIELEALRWGTPAWITSDNDLYTYYKKFLDGAQASYGLNFNYLAADKNENTKASDWSTTGASRNFVVNTLRPKLNLDGYSNVGLVAADSNVGWFIADKAATDTSLRNSLVAMNIHYNQTSTPNAISTGLKLWDGEDLAPSRKDFVIGPLDVAYRIMRMNAVGKLTKYEMHPGVESAYTSTPFTYKSMLVANTPWTGHYDVLPGLWTIAHFTQFSEIGWKYIDSGNHVDDRGGYMMLKDPSSSNWSLIVLNTSATAKDYTFNLSGGLSTGTIHPWKTTESAQFIQQSNITPSGGSFTVTIDPFSIYSFTTTTGQQKGTPSYTNPASETFSLATDYTDNFDGYSVGKEPLYFSDQGGAFEIANEGSGKALEQVITVATKPLDWKYRSTPEPYSIMGSLDWRNYEVQSDVKLTSSAGYVMIGGRVNHNRKTVATEGTDVPADGYQLQMHDGGAWQLRAGTRLLASGTYSGFATNTWYTMKLRFNGTNIKAYINPVSSPGSVTQLASVTDTDFPSGQIQLGSGYNTARFDNLAIRKLDTTTQVDVKRYDNADPNITYVGAWEYVTADYENYYRSQVGSRTANDKLQFSFNGTTAILVGTRDMDGGQADVYLDGSATPSATIDLYAPEKEDRRAIYTVSGLTAGNHTLKLVPKGVHSTGSIDDFVRIDAVEIIGGTNVISKMDYQFTNDTFGTVSPGQLPPFWAIATDSGVTATVELDGTAQKLRLNDTIQTNKALLERKISPASGTVTWEFEYKRTTSTGSWNRLLLSNNSTNGIELYDTDVFGFAYAKPDGSKVSLMNLTAGTNYAIKVVANTATQTFEVWIDGVKKSPSTAPVFTNTVPQFDRMRVQTASSNTATTTAYLDNVSVTAPGGTSQMVIKDTFAGYANGTLAGEPRTTSGTRDIQVLDWTVEGADTSQKCAVDTSQPGGGDSSFKCTDTLSTDHVEATRDFNRTNSGTVTVEYKFKQDAVGKWTRFFVANGLDSAIEIYDSTTAGGLAFKDAAGNEILLGAISANTWYTVRLLIDVDDKNFDAYLDGVPKLMNQAYTNSTFTGIDRAIFKTSDSASVNVWFDNVKVTVQ